MSVRNLQVVWPNMLQANRHVEGMLSCDPTGKPD